MPHPPKRPSGKSHTRVFEEIPRHAPETPLLDRVQTPAQLKQLDLQQLPQLCDELRAWTLYSVGQTGGHLGAGLGVVELTVALHYVLDTPEDRIVWDVGHQCYPHKILTGRRDQMPSMRRKDGLKGFPSRDESPYDNFGTGHSSTSISAALGMALAAPERRCVAVIGDGAMTAGMAYEAMCHAGSIGSNLLVILNDNGMSISPNQGGLRNYLGRLWSSRLYWQVRSASVRTFSPIPVLQRLLRRIEGAFKSFFVTPSGLFESLGFAYTGPVDGQDVTKLVHTLRILAKQQGPQLLHSITRKGAGLSVAEEDPVGYHAIAKIPPLPSQTDTGQTNVSGAPPKPAPPRYQDIFGQWLCAKAAADPHLMAITPAMGEGSGMMDFARDFPDRYHDVAIAEQHALTLAAGMACEDQCKPVVAIYSTFLQRAYDQLIHDLSIQKLDVLLAIDRAGLTGEDGATHAGTFDLSFLRAVPNLVIAAPSDRSEMLKLLDCCYAHKGLAAVRYPRGAVVEIPTALDDDSSASPVRLGCAHLRRQSSKPADSPVLFAFGPLVEAALQAATKLDASVVDMRFVKPLDEDMVLRLAGTHSMAVTLEDNVLQGGAGSAVLEVLQAAGMSLPLLRLGVPDRHLDPASRQQMLADLGLDAEGVYAQIKAFRKGAGKTVPAVAKRKRRTGTTDTV